MTKNDRRLRVRPDGDGTVLAPIELGALRRGEGQAQERRSAPRTDLAHVIADNRATAGKAGLAQALQHLLGT